MLSTTHARLADTQYKCKLIKMCAKLILNLEEAFIFIYRFIYVYRYIYTYTPFPHLSNLMIPSAGTFECLGYIKQCKKYILFCSFCMGAESTAGSAPACRPARLPPPRRPLTGSETRRERGNKKGFSALSFVRFVDRVVFVFILFAASKEIKVYAYCI